MKFGNFENAKENIGKAVRKTVGIATIGLATAGVIGHSNEASAQTVKKKPVEKSIVKPEVKKEGIPPKIHQFDWVDPGTPGFNAQVEIELSTDKKENERRYEIYLFRAEGTNSQSKQISPLESHLSTFPKNASIDSYEFKDTKGANSRVFEISIKGLDKRMFTKGVPPAFFIFCSDKEKLVDLEKITSITDFAIKIDEEGYAYFDGPYSTQEEFFNKLNGLINALNILESKGR